MADDSEDLQEQVEEIENTLDTHIEEDDAAWDALQKDLLKPMEALFLETQKTLEILGQNQEALKQDMQTLFQKVDMKADKEPEKEPEKHPEPEPEPEPEKEPEPAPVLEKQAETVIETEKPKAENRQRIRFL